MPATRDAFPNEDDRIVVLQQGPGAPDPAYALRESASVFLNPLA